MSMRIFSLSLAGLLAACGTASEAPEGPNVACAVGPGSDFADVCILEVVTDDEFIIHHPDGGFRRFVWADNGVLASADGAEPIEYERVDTGSGVREFGLKTDRYRMPNSMMPPPGYE